MTDNAIARLSELRMERARSIAHERFNTPGEHRPSHVISRDIRDATPAAVKAATSNTDRDRKARQDKGRAEAEKRFPEIAPKPEPVDTTDADLDAEQAAREMGRHGFYRLSADPDMRRDAEQRQQRRQG